MTRTVITSSSGGGGAGSATPAINNWASGTFGTGLIRVYGSSGASYSFTVPSGITSIRVRVWGAGGGGGSSSTYSGGGGGGFAIGEFDVAAGDSYAVTVGAGGLPNASGGTSSFSSLISATGGQSAVNSSIHSGGEGVGGYINHKGGFSQNSYCGGGGAASLFGHGGNGTYSGNTNSGINRTRSGGAGGGYGNNSNYIYFNSIRQNFGPWGYNTKWALGGYTDTTTQSLILEHNIDSIDLLATGSGGISYQNAGANGVNGGGGGNGGEGGWPGGGGGPGAGLSTAGMGADGCVIVEY